MATIIKAKHRLAYWGAIIVSALFSVFGKIGPSWATEMKREENATVFNEIYRVAVAPAQSTNIMTQGTRGVTPRDVGANRLIINSDSLEISDAFVQSQIESINAKLQNNQPSLTLEEVNFIRSLNQEKRLNEISDQLKILINIMQTNAPK